MVKGGGAMVAGLHPKHIRNDISECLPHAANTRLKVWRTLLEHAVDIELVDRNPARDVRKVNAPIKGHHCWTDEEITQYRAHHQSGTKARLAFELLLWTGARRGDAVLLGRQHLSGGTLTYVSRKTGVEVPIPILAEFQTEMDQMPKNQMLFLETFNGKPHSDKAFGAWFGKHCRAAGLPTGCTAHGLRKARARIMAEDGKHVHAIAAWGGWKTLTEVAHYTEAANRRKLTHDGMEQEQNTGNSGEPVSKTSENISRINGEI
jgi:integrase